MKKGAKIALGIAGALVIAGGAVAAWQWNNITAARYGLTMDRDTIDQRLEENAKALDDAMEKYNVPKYEISEDELSQLTDGTLDAQDVAKKLLEEQASSGGAEKKQETASSSGTGKKQETASSSGTGKSRRLRPPAEHPPAVPPRRSCRRRRRRSRS